MGMEGVSWDLICKLRILFHPPGSNVASFWTQHRMFSVTCLVLCDNFPTVICLHIACHQCANENYQSHRNCIHISTNTCIVNGCSNVIVWWHTGQFQVPLSGTSQLITKTGQSVILFWCQKLAPGREHVQFRSRNRLKNWTVIGQSEQTIALLVCFLNKDERWSCFFLWNFFNNLNAKTVPITPSSSKFSKWESVFIFCVGIRAVTIDALINALIN